MLISQMRILNRNKTKIKKKTTEEAKLRLNIRIKTMKKVAKSRKKREQARIVQLRHTI